MKVLVLGAGFGGLELSTRLSDEFGDDVDVVLIDQGDGFVFGFSKLDVMFGRRTADASCTRMPTSSSPGCGSSRPRSGRSTPTRGRIETDAGAFDADVMVVALGADLHPEATPGLVEAGHEFYTVPGAFALRDVLADFAGGRVVVGVTSTPFKCPPAPSETALLMHDFLTERGLRDRSEIALVMPLPVPIPPSPDASEALLERLRGTRHRMASRTCGARARSRPEGRPLRRRRARCRSTCSSVCPSTACPRSSPTRACASTAGSRSTRSRSTPRSRRVRRRRRDQRRDAEGRRVRRGSSRGRRRRDHRPPVAGRAAGYDGRGICYLEFGDDQGRRRRRHVRRRPSAVRLLNGPSVELAADKAEFGTTRIKRWFGNDW